MHRTYLLSNTDSNSEARSAKNSTASRSSPPTNVKNKNRLNIRSRTINTSPTISHSDTTNIKHALNTSDEPEVFHPFVNRFLLNDSSFEPFTPRSSVARKAAPLAAYCRLKPTKSKNLLLDQPTDNSISIRVPKNSTDTTVNNTKELWSFPFTSILADDNFDVYKEIASPAVLGLFQNVSSTFFVYGGIASGKTYTLFGSPTCVSQESIGLIPLSLHSIFRRLTDDQEVLLSFVELKDDEVYDLLQTSSDEHGKKSPRMLNSSIICSASSNPMVTSIPGLSQNKVSKLREALVMLSNANDLRRVERTKWNAVSTRSHVVLSIHLVSKVQQTHSKLCFVDLAAPIKVTDIPINQSSFIRRSVKINQSLFFLEGVLSAVTNQKKHVPYRNCPLTSVLRFYMSYSPRLIMIASLDLDPGAVSESLSTCLFFRRIGLVKGLKHQGNKPKMEKILEGEQVMARRGSIARPPLAQNSLDLFKKSTQDQDSKLSEHQESLFDQSQSSSKVHHFTSSTTSHKSESSGKTKFTSMLENVIDNEVTYHSTDSNEDDRESLCGELPSGDDSTSLIDPDCRHVSEVSIKVEDGFQVSTSEEESLGYRSIDTEASLSEVVTPEIKKERVVPEYARLFSWKKLKAIVVYSSIILFFMLIFLGFSFPSLSDIFGDVICPQSLVLDAGTVQYRLSRDLEWSLHQGGSGTVFIGEIYFNQEFTSEPNVFIAIGSIESSHPASVDVVLTLRSTSHFEIRITRFLPAYINELTVTWIAVGQNCIDDVRSVDFRGAPTLQQIPEEEDPIESQMIDHVTFWDGHQPLPLEIGSFESLNSSLVYFYSISALRFSPETNFNNLNIYNSFQLVNSSGSDDLVYFYHGIRSKGLLEDARYNFVMFEKDFVVYNNFVYDVIRLSSDSHVDYNLDDSDYSYLSIRAEFSSDFNRIPDVVLFLLEYDCGETALKYSIEIKSVDYSGFEFFVLSLEGSTITSISFNYLAFDEDFDVFDAVDYFLLLLFFLFLILALAFEHFKPSFKTAPNTSYEMYHSLPKDWITTEERNEEPAPQCPNQVFNNETWVSMLEHFEDLKKNFHPGTRDFVEIFFCVVFALLLLLIVFLFYRDFIVANKLFHSFQSIYVTMFILGLEYLLLLLAFVSVSWPEHRLVKGYNAQNNHVAILIASHISAGRDPDLILKNSTKNFFRPPSREDLEEIREGKCDDFERTLRLASSSCADGNVYVCHNANMKEPYPNDKTISVIKRLKKWGRQVNYVYIPTGNKTFAYKITHVVIMDDDVQIPSDMSWQTHLMEEPDVAGAVITIRADINQPKLKHSWRRRSLLVWFQDMEYMLSGLMKLCQSNFGSAAYPHGAISIWKKELLVTVLDHHNSAFHGEDTQIGFLLREKFANPPRLITLSATPALTSPPTDIFHAGEDFFGDHVVDDKSLFAQRVKSWDACAHRFFFKYCEHILRFWSSDTFILKFFYLYEVATIIRDYFHILIILYFIMLQDYALLGLVYYRVILIQNVFIFTFNYIKLRRRKDLQSPFIVVLLFPFYRLMLLMFRVFAMLYNLFEYLPKKRMPTAEDPHLKVPYFHNYLSLLSHPEMWQKVWDIEKVKQGPEVFLPDDLPPIALTSSMSRASSMAFSPRQVSSFFEVDSPSNSENPTVISPPKSDSLLKRAVSMSHLNAGQEKTLYRTDSMLTKTRSMTKLLHWDEYLD
ncbi:hypothetical protein GEMRC1_007786 [Eukaryota sp. GEM-RC1]